MDKDFPYHYRIDKGSQFKYETPSSVGRNIETIGSPSATRITFDNGDELFQIFSRDFVDLFSTFELKIEAY
ncbi:hypothetical protein [Leuconostoc gasicomitatum]|uniref:hypothetical protein n=1 Tax=Leuconostoc gasicomitatum TaxID=115778 RepID=UPI001CC68F9C|nr:hypothetical protein [Leuconostoc gasicomitatum]MBZ5969012.1 hypothetical protein [Leuconostoc gasicomitatum]MBZ5998504.1 hypothetical protein [Leuconostoc gasicomitatum]